MAEIAFAYVIIFHGFVFSPREKCKQNAKTALTHDDTTSQLKLQIGYNTCLDLRNAFVFKTVAVIYVLIILERQIELR